jgi:hypothetical protein
MRIGLLLALAGVATMPHITMEQTAKGYTAKVATFDLRQQAEVDAEIERRAASLCGDREIRWGEFSSLAKLGKNPSSEPAPVTGYSKAFSCVAPDPRIYDPAPADWKPTSADTHDAIALFETYYSKRDGGDFLGAMRLFAPGVLRDAANWAAEMTVTNNKIGKGKRRITGVTWYVNPDGAPHPGVYVAIDFIGDFPKTYVYCGYVALYRREPGSYEVTREEQNMFTHGDGTADQARISQMRENMCRGQ